MTKATPSISPAFTPGMTGYSTFFSATAEIAGTLIGLIFVAISLSPHDWRGSATPFPFRARTTTAFTTLVSALVVSLVALLPDDNLGTAGLITGILGFSTTIGLTVHGVRHGEGRRHAWDLFAVAYVGCAYIAQLIVSGYLLTGATRPGAVETQAILVMVFFLLAIERAWQTIGGRDSRLLSVIAETARNRIGGAP